MSNFLNDFIQYCKRAEYSSVLFWAFPIFTLMLIWLSTIVSLKLTPRKKMKTVFLIHRNWIICSLAVAFLLTSLICYWWVANFFSNHPFQLSLLTSLLLAMLIPVIHFIRLRRYYTIERLKEIFDQPKTQSQLETAVIGSKRAFSRIKFWYLLPFAGLMFLLISLNKGKNLISVIVDNTPSQGIKFEEIKSALRNTLSKLDNNSHVIITTFEECADVKSSFQDIIKSTTYSPHCEASAIFNTPEQAMSYITSLNSSKGGSPIMEVTWQNYLYAKQMAASTPFRNKTLIVITDGEENAYKPDDKSTLCNAGDFNTFFSPQSVFILNYGTEENVFMRNAEGCGYRVQAGNSVSDYSFALDRMLRNFQKNPNLVYCTLFILGLLTLIGFFTDPKKID